MGGVDFTGIYMLCSFKLLASRSERDKVILNTCCYIFYL